MRSKLQSTAPLQTARSGGRSGRARLLLSELHAAGGGSGYAGKVLLDAGMKAVLPPLFPMGKRPGREGAPCTTTATGKGLQVDP